MSPDLLSVLPVADNNKGDLIPAEMSFSGHPSLVLLIFSTVVTAIHFGSDVSSLARGHGPNAGDYQSACVVSLRLMSLVASIILLRRAHDSHWIDFCVVTSLLLLLVGEVRLQSPWEKTPC